MADFLRAIKRARWIRDPSWTWLGANEVHAGAIFDLETEDNALSVYKVQGKADITRVVDALAANREFVSSIDYVVFDDASLIASGITFSFSPGETPDSYVNQMHYDIINLTASQLAEVALAVWLGGRDRILEKKIKDRLKQALANQSLDRQKMKDKLLAKLV